MASNQRHNLQQFLQGQVAVVLQLPDDGVAFGEQRLRLRLAPPDVRHIDVNNLLA